MPSTNPSLRFYLAFLRVKGIGAARLRKLEGYFPTMEDAWRGSQMDFIAAGLDERSAYAIASQRPKIDPEAELKTLEKSGAKAITWNDQDYPRLLREVDDPPPVLFVRGEITPADQFAVAMVGTRSATVYGRQVAELFTRELVENKITVVSGLARGIDAVAHAAALNAGGRTIAVLGCGVDVVYPPEHRNLAAKIVEHGAIVSDYAIGTPPDRNNFPPRNRIISGLSLGVVVVEADEQSGAIITAKFAAEQGRDVFAVPGNIFNQASRGTNRLIREGAKMALETRDILEELNLQMATEHVDAQMSLPLEEHEQVIYNRLSYDPIPTDELVRGLDLPAEVVNATLSLMELKGYVRQSGGAGYARAREPRGEYLTSDG
ncbi:MAG TPA: DNA-processing protein DprA [Thermoflexales bacterium]|nr:DNA-processing protein DprA [Thermoflexales bacterium]HQW36484.1 DNA-processing protein DprA [Thermoflexales bacterium]HQZ20988.1 DNA-processing protein DprA [Thermoflexales bacterium]HRA00560.1 DNA-processing protein DprA [Thermoflexales bacterium]